MSRLEDRVFLLIVALASLAMAWIVEPFFGAVLWGIVIAILFAPVNDRLRERLSGRNGTAALLTTLAVILIVIIPAAFLGSMMLQEAARAYDGIRSGHIDFGRYFAQILNALPSWASNMLDRYGLSDVRSLQAKISSGIGGSVQILATRAFAITQSAFGLFLSLGVMLYLTFFLLRDGRETAEIIDRAVPLRPEQWRALVKRFETVIRATIKGTVVVAIVQGFIGGVTFWLLGVQGALLWGVAMGFMSLVPAIGSALVWIPVALYLFAVGAIWQGVVLVLVCALIIGSIDNILRPILVGRDTRMPDYIVLISTLGGIEIFGFNGFVIGPVIAALFMSVWEIFAEERNGTPLVEPRAAHAKTAVTSGPVAKRVRAAVTAKKAD